MEQQVKELIRMYEAFIKYSDEQTASVLRLVVKDLNLLMK